MRRGRPVSELTLTADERTALERWVRRGKTSQSLAQRARIVLACAEGKINTAVAGLVGVGRLTGSGAPVPRNGVWTACLTGPGQAHRAR